jgi:hypothetical protein
MPADPLLSNAEAAARAGMKTRSWRSAVSRGYAPPADEPDLETPQMERQPRWKASTVDAWLAERPGQGHRSDLDAARAERRRRDAADLAAPRPAADRAMRDWLAANHRALLAVAELVADHRDALVDAAPAQHRADLADAIDRAGQEMSGQPSRMLAAAVTYCLFLLRPDVPVRAGLEAEVCGVLAHHDRLHGEFNGLRG